MKNILLIATLAILAASCNSRDASANPSDPSSDAPISTPSPYPLDVCIVSDEELGSMGEPVVIIHQGQEIKFCCATCQPSFEKNPDKYLGKLAM